MKSDTDRLAMRVPLNKNRELVSSSSPPSSSVRDKERSLLGLVARAANSLSASPLASHELVQQVLRELAALLELDLVVLFPPAPDDGEDNLVVWSGADDRTVPTNIRECIEAAYPGSIEPTIVLRRSGTGLTTAKREILQQLQVHSLHLGFSGADGQRQLVLALSPAPRGAMLHVPLLVLGSILATLQASRDSAADVSMSPSTAAMLAPAGVSTAVERYQSFLASESVALALLRRDGVVREANDAALLALGRTRSELENGEISWLDHTPDEELPAANARMQDFLSAGTVPPWRSSLRRLDGQRLTALQAALPCPGEPDSALLVGMDVSAIQTAEEILRQRNAEVLLAAQLAKQFIDARENDIDPLLEEAIARIRETFEADVAVMFLTSTDSDAGKVLAASTSKAASSVREGRPPSNMNSAEYAWLMDLLHSGVPFHVNDAEIADQAKHPEAFAWMRKKRLRAAIAIPVLRDGKLSAFVTLGALTARPQWSGEVLASTMILGEMFANAMDRKRSAKEIRSAQAILELRVRERTAKLENLNRELTAFSSAVSHDLRSPLRSINGYAKILREEYDTQLGPHAQGLLGDITRSTQRMSELIDALLRLTRIARSEVHPEEVDLAVVARDIAASLREGEPDRAVRFLIAATLPVRGDAHLLQILMDNLIRNAWKFTTIRDLGEIEIGAESRDGKAAFFVRDNGTGFDPRNAANLFGTFQRLHHASEYPGHGAGLAIVQRIASLHGGAVWAEGVVNGGATFWFTLS